MQHFFTDCALGQDHASINDPLLLHQVRNVLRFREGDECVLLDGKGTKTQAVLRKIEKRELVFEILRRENFTEPVRKVRLYIALAKKPATFELILQKATELGSTEIIPLVTEYCQTHDLHKKDRLKMIIREAAEQSERIFLPELAEPVTFENFLKNLPDGQILFGESREDCRNLAEFDFANQANVNILIGPEGGFSPDEIAALQKAGALPFSLGKNILRMETAAIAALAIIQAKV